MFERVRKLQLLVLYLTLLTSSALVAQEQAPKNSSITSEDLKADLFFLASDEMQGRLVGTLGNRLAGEFIKSRFQRLGLKPIGTDGSFFQSYDLISTTLGQENKLTIKNDREETLQLLKDYYPQNFSASGYVEGSLVYVGFGITVPDLSYNDYTNEALRGKIALVLDHEPGERDPDSPFDGLLSSEWSRPFRKALFAQEHGAIGILFVSDVHNHEATTFETLAGRYWPEHPGRIERYGLGAWMDQVQIPALRISPKTANVLIRHLGQSLHELAKSAETVHGISPIPLPNLEIALSTTVNRRRLPDHNVVGLLEGSDPRVSDEWIILSAHYDHNGADGSEIFNGADDDGSGVVGLIEIAEAYALAAQNGHKPRRSILFAAWNSEERGLLGSWAYTERPLAPLSQTVAVLNMDMIGRNEEIPENGGNRFRGLDPQIAQSNSNAVNVLGYSRSQDLRMEVEKANAWTKLDLKFRYDNNPSNLLRRSDQWPFLYHRVPAVFFHSGLHPDYHTPRDRPEAINYEKLERVVRLVHQLSWTLAQQEERPIID